MGKITGTAWIIDKGNTDVWVVAPFMTCDLFYNCRPNNDWLNSSAGYITNKDEYPDLVEGDVVECITQFSSYAPDESELNPHGFIFNAEIIKRLTNYFY